MADFVRARKFVLFPNIVMKHGKIASSEQTKKSLVCSNQLLVHAMANMRLFSKKGSTQTLVHEPVPPLLGISE